MKRIRFLAIIISLVCLSANGRAQEPEMPDSTAVPSLDMRAIKSAANEAESPFYFPVLMQRYLDEDTTLTADDYRHLYYGYTFQEDYDPYRVSAYASAIDSLYDRHEFTPDECAAIVKYARMALADNPFDLRRMSVLIYVYTISGQEDEALFWQTRLRRLLDTILASGDGTTPETAWQVIAPEHAYDLLNTIGVVPETYEFQPPSYDYIGVYDMIGNERGFYFNVERLLDEYRHKFHTESLSLENT